MSVSLIAGLGNPGKSYKETRHNAGFQLLDSYVGACGGTWKAESKFLSDHCTLKQGSNSFHFIKPQTFMNRSGDALRKCADYYKIPADQVIVAYDDVGLDLGRLKINREGGSGGHNGLEDIFQKLGRSFIRFRIGVGSKYPAEIDLADFVLSPFSKEEADVIKQQMNHYHQALDYLLRKGVTLAMNHFNQRKPKHDADKTNL